MRKKIWRGVWAWSQKLGTEIVLEELKVLFKELLRVFFPFSHRFFDSFGVLCFIFFSCWEICTKWSQSTMLMNKREKQNFWSPFQSSIIFFWKIFPFRISTDGGHIILKHFPCFNKTSETTYSSKQDPVTSSTYSRSPTNTVLPLHSFLLSALQPHTSTLSVGCFLFCYKRNWDSVPMRHVVLS